MYTVHRIISCVTVDVSYSTTVYLPAVPTFGSIRVDALHRCLHCSFLLFVIKQERRNRLQLPVAPLYCLQDRLHHLSARTMGAFNSKQPVKRTAGGSISDVDRAVLDLKNARDRLQKYRAKLEGEEIKLLQRAKEAKDAGKTKQALGLLRLKKYKSRGVEDVENQLLTVLQMVETIDSKKNEKELLGALRTGKDALAKLQKETTVEDVLDLMDQIQEQNEVEKEVSDILSGVPSLSVEDEALVEAELEAMEAEMNAEANPELPQVPTNKLPEIAKPEKEPATAKPGRVAVTS